MSTIDRNGGIHDNTNGQFTGHLLTESDAAVLSGAQQPLDDPHVLADRLRLLTSQLGYVPARSFGTIGVDLDTWWGAQFEAAEYAPAGKAFPKMPDDFTPGMTSGRATSGHRRTHRATYRGDQVDLVMPSASSVRAFARQNGGTFDLPVQATDKAGNQITAWVRCTPLEGNRWITSGLGFGGRDDAVVSEAVAAVLEARRPKLALRHTGDLIAAHRERVAASGVVMHPVTSSWVSSVGYSPEDQMTVMETKPYTTKQGQERPARLYGYRTGPAAYQRMANSPSPGRTFPETLKGQPRLELAQCPTCGRVYALVHRHTCTTSHPRPDGEFDQSAYRRAAVQSASDVWQAINLRANPGAQA